jgi:hypothetical protein
MDGEVAVNVVSRNVQSSASKASGASLAGQKFGAAKGPTGLSLPAGGPNPNPNPSPGPSPDPSPDPDPNPNPLALNSTPTLTLTLTRPEHGGVGRCEDRGHR